MNFGLYYRAIGVQFSLLCYFALHDQFGDASIELFLRFRTNQVCNAYKGYVVRYHIQIHLTTDWGLYVE
jgi:hypothetical protein